MNTHQSPEAFRALREQNADLEERAKEAIKQLKIIRDGLIDEGYGIFKFTPYEQVCLGVLMKRDYPTTDIFMAALYGMSERENIHPYIIKVMVCRMRRKLKPFGVSIQTKYSCGYYMTAENKDRVREIAGGNHG